MVAPVPSWVELLVCPQCRGDLREHPAPDPGLDCPQCRLTFPIVDGVPWMAEELAVRWERDP